MSIDRLFVYGTLKPGQSRWSALAPFVDPRVPPVPAEVEGQLWTTPWGWPAFTLGIGSVRFGSVRFGSVRFGSVRFGSVRGILVALRSDLTGEALAHLDKIEGVDTGLFERITTQTSDGNACSIYLWPNDTEGFSSLDGEWRAPLSAP